MALSDILAQLFGNNNAATPPAASQGAPAPAPQGQPPVAPPNANPDYGSFIQSLLNSANAHISSQTPGVDRSLGDWFSGNDRKAAAADINGQPGWQAWQQFKQAQASAQNAQLDAAVKPAQIAGAAGIPAIDPNNPNASIPALTAAYGGMTGTPQAAPAPQGPPMPTPAPQAANPTPNAPALAMNQSAAPPPAQAAPVDPLQANRQFYQRAGRNQLIMNNPAGAKDFYALANAGLPEGTALAQDGSVRDGANGQPITMTATQLAAEKAGKIEAAKAPTTEAVAANQAALDRKTKQVGDADAAQYNMNTGYSLVDGQPALASNADIANGNAPHFAPGANPYKPKQDTEVQAAQQNSDEASNTIIQLRTLQAALHGLKTGAGGEALQTVRRSLSALGLDDSLDAAKGDVSKQVGLEVAAMRARAASGGRTALGTLKAFISAKPGLSSTDPDVQINSLIPGYQRQVDYGNFTSGYYGKGPNWNKLDAPSAFEKANPDQKYVDQAGLSEDTDPTKYGLPAGTPFVGRNKGKPLFTFNGKTVKGE